MVEKTLPFALWMVVAAGCGSSASTLAAVGDDCSSDSACASGLCDTGHFCAAVVASLDGKACTADKDCPTGDHCNTADGKCFSSAQDGKGGNNSCTTNADCSSDETCDTTTGMCVG